jgi:hypothetical protein
MADVVNLGKPGDKAEAEVEFAEALQKAALRGEIPRPRHSTEVFRPAEPMPGVVPQGGQTMAMDAAVVNSSDWAVTQLMSAYYADGQVFLGYPVLAELAQRGEYRRIAETIATEMTREWIDLKSSSDEDKSDTINAMHDEIKRLGVQDTFRRLAEQDGFFGRAHLYIDLGVTDIPDELKTPIGHGRDLISQAKVRRGGLRGLRVVEAVWTYPIDYNASDPLRPDWYKPQSWFVMGKMIHATRLLTLVGREVPDLLKPAYMFGGVPLTQMAKSYVERFLQTRDSVADLIRSFSTSGVLTDLTAMLNRGGQATVENRADLYNFFRDNRGLMILNKETEEFFNVSVPLGGLDALQAQSLEQICSISGLPLIKYTGLTPSGLNASSEGEIRSFYDWIAAYQELLFREPLTRVLDFIQLSIFGAVDPDITFDFKSLWQLDEAGKASVQQTMADIHEKYEQMGAVSNEEIRKILATDPDSPYAALSLDPEELPQQDIPGMMGGMPGGGVAGMPGASPMGGGGPGGLPPGGGPHSGGGGASVTSVTSPFGASRDPAAGRQSAGARAHRMGDALGRDTLGYDETRFEEGKHKRDEGGKFSSTGGGGGGGAGATTERSAATQTARPGRMRRMLGNIGKEDYETIKKELPKGSDTRKTWAAHVAGIGRSLPQLLKSHLKDEKDNAIAAAGALKSIATGNKPTSAQLKGLGKLGTRLLLSAGSFALGDPTGTVGHAMMALAQEVGQHVAFEHAGTALVGAGRAAMMGGGDQQPGEQPDDLSPEDLALLQKYIEKLAKALLDYEPEDPEDDNDEDDEPADK